MLDYHPTKRLMITDLIGHPWLQGEYPTTEEIKSAFAQRKALNSKVLGISDEIDVEMEVKMSKPLKSRGEGKEYKIIYPNQVLT